MSINIKSDIDKIEKIIEKMKEKALNLELKIEARENSFFDKSEKWQESEKGEAYEKKTEEMQELFDSVNDEIETIESAIQELRELI